MVFERVLGRMSGRRVHRLGSRRLAAVGLAGVLVAGGVMTATAADRGPRNASPSGKNGPATITARLFAQVAPLDPPGANGALTNLEGPAFGPDGDLYMVHPTAPAGRPKVIALNLRTHEVRTVYTDSTSRFSSVQFSPADGKMYLTDNNGKIDRMNPDGTGFTTLLSTPVLGRPLSANDLTFDQSGAMFVTDYHGTPWEPTGRVIRLDPDGTHPTLLMDGLAGANGISFDPAYSGLWVSELGAGRVDYLRLSADHTTVTMPSVGMYGNQGVGGFDSNAVDADGNVYQCVIGDGKVDVFSPQGELLATVVVPQTMSSPELLTANLVIKPGTRDGYLVVGGGNGGFVYTFPALGLGDAQSNGGGASG